METFLQYNTPNLILDHNCEYSEEECAMIISIIVEKINDEIEDMLQSIIDMSSNSLFDKNQYHIHNGGVIIKIFEENYDLYEPHKIIYMNLESENLINILLDEEGKPNKAWTIYKHIEDTDLFSNLKL